MNDDAPKATAYVHNITKDDFTVTYDTNQDGNPVEYTVEAGEIREFPIAIADHVKKHLAHKITNIRGIKINRYEEEYAAAMKEISV